MKKTVWIARTAVCLALLIAIQFLTKRLVRQSGAGHRGADRRRLVRRDGRGHFAVLRVSARYRPGVFAVGAVRFAGQRRLRRPVCPACRQIPAKKEAARRIWQHGAGCRSKVCSAVSRPCPAGGPGCHPGSEAQHRHSGFYLAAASHSRDRRRAGLPDRSPLDVSGREYYSFHSYLRTLLIS